MEPRFMPTSKNTRRPRFSLSTWFPLLLVLLGTTCTINARASDLAEMLSIDPPELPLGHYIALLYQRDPFIESGPVALEIDGSLPALEKRASLAAIRQIGASEHAQYQVLKTEGDPMVKRDVIARYLSAQAQAEGIPLLSMLISPANYKFRYIGPARTPGKLSYVFSVSPRKNRVGLIRGEIWIDPVTGVSVHEAGHFVKSPSVFLQRIDIVRDTILRNGLPYLRITHAAIKTRVRAFSAELTITEGPLSPPDIEWSSQLTGERGRP